MAEQRHAARVSVIVPVYNGGRAVCETVRCLLRQTLRPAQIIVVDDGSTDDTLALLKGFGNEILLLSQRNGGPSSARNHGLRFADADFIAFTDSDCLPQPGWLSELIGGFSGPDVGGVGGCVRRADNCLFSEYADIYGVLAPEVNADGEIMYFPTANVCFRADVLLEAGAFDENFRKPGAEDVDVCIRVRDLGYKLRYSESAVVLHHHKNSLRALLRTMTNYGEGHYILCAKRPEINGIARPFQALVRSSFAVRSMVRRCFSYRPAYGLKKSALFSFLDHYKYSAYIWGYIRGERIVRRRQGLVRSASTGSARPLGEEGDGVKL
ncbi:MAG TPA: glycosyltransferase [Pyrinomonadaceae bacterium]|nr:glycosyltransferase [Pyrinomonadaceae bacterium]